MLDGYAMPNVDTNLQEPFASRLLKLLEFFDHRLMVLSGRRSRGEQQELYDRYLAGGNLAAKPGTSNHEKGLAADLERTDPALSWAEVHTAANKVGIWFPVIGENWHAEAMHDFIEPEEWDLTDDDMRKLAGYIAEALDARPRSVHSYNDGTQADTNARTLEEWSQMELQQIRRK